MHSALPLSLNALSLFVSLALLLLSGQVRAEQGTSAQGAPNRCASFDLRSRPNARFETLRARDQGALSLCYAFTGARLVDYWRFSHPWPKGDANYTHLTSPVAAAISNDYQKLLRETGATSLSPPKKKDAYRWTQGGDICEIVNEIKRAKSCDDRSIPLKFGNNKDYASYVTDLRYLLDQYQARLSRSGRGDSAIERQRTVRGICEVCSRYSIELTENLRSQVFEALRFQSPDLVMKTLLSDRCDDGHRQAVGGFDCMVGDFMSPEQFEDVLERHFRKPESAQPMALNFCGTLLSSTRDYVGGRWQGSSFVANKDCGPHAAIVVGRRMHEGRCQLLIENSWGVSDEPYYRTLERDRKGNPVVQVRAWESREGKVWVDQDTLARNSAQFFYLENEQ